MAYLGSPPAATTASFAGVYSQAFNGDGSTTSFTLGRYVAQAANIEVIVNNVQQSPFDGSYTLSGGTTLVFSEAPNSGTNNIYVIYRDYPVQTLTDTGAVRKTGDTMTGALVVSNESMTESALVGSNATDYDQLQIKQPNRGGFFGWQCSGVNSENYVVIDRQRSNSVLEIHGTTNHIFRTSNLDRLSISNSGYVTMPYQPCFKVYATTNFSLTTSYYTVIPMAGVEWNISSAWSTSTNRFTAPVTGKYQFNFSFRMHSVTNYAYGYLRQNGSNMFYWHTEQTVGSYERKAYSTILSLNVGDYVDLTAGANSNVGYFDIVELSGFLIG